MSAVARFGVAVSQIAWLWGRSVRLLPAVRGPRFTEALFTLGVASGPLVLIATFFSGMVLALQVSVELTRFGSTELIAGVVGVTFVRELGPVFTALLLAGKAGSGIASEFGGLLLSDQLRAMRALSIDVERRFVAPTVWAAVLATVGLTLLADVAGVFGGLVLSAAQLGVSPVVYLNETVRAIAWSDLASSFVKSVVFGHVVALAGVWYGLRDKRSARDLGADTMRAVVSASFLVLVLDNVTSRVLVAVFGE